MEEACRGFPTVGSAPRVFLETKRSPHVPRAVKSKLKNKQVSDVAHQVVIRQLTETLHLFVAA